MTGIEAITDLMGQNPAALAFGLTGLVCQLIWPLMRTRNAMLIVQLGIGSSYGLQYMAFDAWSGAGVAFIGAAQTVIALAAGDRPSLRKLGLLFLPLVAVVCFFTWGGVSSLLACTACALVMVGRLQSDTLALRIFLLAAAPFGIGYDISIGALPALCGGIASASIAATMLVHEVRERYPSLCGTTDRDSLEWRLNGHRV